MEITNFKSVLPQIRSAIEDSVFISFDTEFTGLNIKDAPSVGPYDTAPEAYEKLRQSANFSVIQFGLCTFHEDPDDGRLTHKAYNFYTIPTHDNFLCQTDSLKFLVNHGMDLNKVFKDGIITLRKEDRDVKVAFLEEKLKAVKERASKPQGISQNLQASDGQKEVVASIKTKIEAFLESDDEELVLGNFNSFQRLLLHQLIQNDFDNKVFLLTKRGEGRNVSLHAYKGGVADKIKREESQIQEEIIELQGDCGMSAVLSAIKTSGKLVVGHNVLLDVIHTVHQFVDNLPEDMKSFKRLVSYTFPRIIDTKTLATQTVLVDKLETSTLEPMVKCLQEPPFQLIDAPPVTGSQGYSLDGGLAHEAGFDAYLTGLCFATMVKYLDKDNENFRIKTVSPKVLEAHINKLPYVFYGDLPGFFDLNKDEPIVNRDHVFHMQVPTHWNTGDISKLYSPFGGVKISWINNKECLVELFKKGEAKKVKSVIGKSSTSKNFTLQTLASYKQETKSENKRRRGDSERGSDRQASKKQKGEEENSATPRAASPFESAPWSDASSENEDDKSMSSS
ncbi:poly(A)-specific ribonuclease PARN-like isoform X2 [Neocloeon triangulifer]|uniref:poly(A)-specific ribonuclease PARN-like isoform X2 n=1 Tax=Neocloeon triangulifer TaxID=2078957 RepID=UPI00286FA850|nr:poly(A)-specific ribonuclease PARN-like isoform X2 [Neocloeon triangulifer]